MNHKFKLPSGREIKLPPERLRNNPAWIDAIESLLDGVDAGFNAQQLAPLAIECAAAALGLEEKP